MGFVVAGPRLKDQVLGLCFEAPLWRAPIAVEAYVALEYDEPSDIYDTDTAAGQ